MSFWERYSQEKSREAEAVAAKNKEGVRILDRQIDPNGNGFDAYMKLSLQDRLNKVDTLLGLERAAREAREELAKQRELAHGEALRIVERHDRLLKQVEKAVADLREFEAEKLGKHDQVGKEE